ncbi:MAG TPA: Gfo/Idh/MocA family oxidoreductase [Euzebyales bacterium]|nr:Gfo/Idh/MocA family oxidoreductase [Euzebyales bacterium]
MTETSKVGLAVIGLGWWGGVLATAIGANEDTELVSCFARNPDARQAFADKHGGRPADSFEAILSDPAVDGVVLATPHSTHAQQIAAAAAAGRHVFVEKPMTLSVAEARDSVAAARSAGVILQVGHNKRRQAGNRWLHTELAAGTLGQLQSIEANVSAPMAFKPGLPAWRQDASELPAGGMTPLGVHMIDTILHLGGPVREVFCWSRRVAGRIAVDDVTMVLLQLDGGGLAYLSTQIATPQVTTVNVYGTEAAAYSEADGTRLFVQRRGAPYRDEVPVERIDTVRDEIAEFARCIRSGDEPETGGAQGLAVVEVFEAVVRSAASGTPEPVG